MHPRPRSRLTLEVIGLSKHRSLAALLALLVCLAFLPSPAYAIDIWPNGTMYEEDTDTLHNWFGRADSVYDAAVYAMGHSPSELTDEMRLMLSDPNYGGDFYAYALSFYHVDGWFDIPSFVPTYALGTIGLVQDFDRVYASSRSISDYESAFQDFLRILHGEIPDGGSSGGTPENPDLDIPSSVSFNMDNWVGPDSKCVWTDAYSSNPVPLDISGTVDISSIRARISSYTGDLRYVTYFFFKNGAFSDSPYVNKQLSYYIFLTANPPTVTPGVGIYFSGRGTECYGDLTPSVPSNYSDTSFNLSGARWLGRVVDYGNNYKAASLDNSSFVAGNYIPSGPPDPDGDWPSDSGVSVPAPVVPDPDPEPSISGTVVVAPSVTWPDVDITINNNDPENTTPADYTPWLQAINASLNSLRSDLLVEFDAIQQSIRNIYYYLQHLDTIFESHCVHIRNQIIDSTNHLELYLRDLVHWLAEQLDYDANVDLDDNAIIAYLTQISSKMGGGTYEPNPISNEESYYAWLDDLWDRFLLGDNWESSAQSISSSFSQLTTRFPFSIPWDIVALFRLFVHDPVTPVFDLPLFFSSDSYAPVHVDLSGWDGVAAMVRPVIYVIFALKLALLSRDLLAGFGADKGGL